MSAVENKYLITVTSDDIKNLKVKNINFLFPIKDLSVGFPKTYSKEEIDIRNSYIYVNIVLDNKGIKLLEETLKNINNNIIGICFTDLGVINIAKKIKPNLKLFYMQNHNTTNYETINYYLNDVDSLIVSTDITKEEIIKILDNSHKSLIMPFYTKVNVCYSRRLLLSNYTEEFNLPKENIITLKEKNSNSEFTVIENNNGTVFYQDEFIDYREIKHKNILMYYLNPLGLKKQEVEDIISGKTLKNSSTGFLNKETYYSLEDVK